MKILILGHGVSGRAAYHFAKHQGHDVIVVDKQPQEFPYVIHENELNDFSFDLAILSPGIRGGHKLVKTLLSYQVPITGEMEYGLGFLPRKKRVIGITGTNGKTTTTMLLTHILNHSGKKAVAVGNIGMPICEYLLNDNTSHDYIICEVSSFQLETMKQKNFDLVAITNISEDHLDAYSSFEEYKAAKYNILQLIKEGGKIVLSDTEHLENIPNATYTDNSCYIIAERMAELLGISRDEIKKAMSSFNRPDHRLETVKVKNGITFVNDSKSTNIESTLYAAKTVNQPILLLAGGKDKGFSFAKWSSMLSKNVKRVYAFGETAGKIKGDINSSFEVQVCNDLLEALKCAYASGVEGDCILLSPGCSSFDQFKNYIHRGEEFRKLVQELGEEH